MLDWKAEVEKKAKADGVSDRDFYKEDGYHINETKGKELYIQFLKDSLKGSGGDDSEKCIPSSTSSDGNLQEYVKKYAHPDSVSRLKQMPDYANAISTAKSDGRYIGTCSGNDCGGFVTTLLYDSGFDKRYDTFLHTRAKTGFTPRAKIALWFVMVVCGFFCRCVTTCVSPCLVATEAITMLPYM